MSFDAMWSALESVGRHPRTGGYRRFAWTRDDTTLREWFAGEAAARGLDLDPGPRRQPVGVVGRPGRRGGGRPPRAGPRLAPGLRPRRWRVRRPARRRVRLRRAGPAGGAGVHPGPADRHRQLRRRGGCPLRHRLRGVAAADRPARPRPGPGAARRRRRHPGRGDGRGRARPGPPRPRPRDAAPDRHVRRAARRAGPGPGRPRPPGRRRVGDLAARPVAARPGGRGQPRGHHPAGGPPRPDAGARRGRARRAVHRAGARLPRDRGQGAGGAGRRQRHPVPGDRVARRPRAGRPRRARGGRRGRRRRPGWSRSRSRGPPRRAFDAALAGDLAPALDGAPLLSTGAGHDAGVLATAGLSTAMLFVRNPTGVSHSPREHAEPEDCHRGVEALARVARELAG